MKLDRPMVFFDLETTGLSQTTDRIVEMYIIKENLDGTEEEFYSKFNPYPVLVSSEAERVHGLSNADLINEPVFADKVDEILKFIEGSDIGGYNINRFDIPLLFEEIARTGKIYDFRKHRIIDTFLIWTAYEPRTLTGAVKRFLGESHENAHEAKADVIATKRIFHKQMEAYRGQYTDLDEIVNVTVPTKGKVDMAGKFHQNEEGVLTITFGKHKDKTVNAIFAEDPEYFRWIFEKSEMATDTRLIAKKIYSKLSEIKNEA
jgi:DNA polymerase-3 subunit epsilon